MDGLERTPKAFNSNARKKIFLLLQEEAGEKGMTLQDFLTSLKDRTKLNLRKMSQFFGYASIFHALQSLDDVLYYKKDPTNNIVYVYPRRKYLTSGSSSTPLSPLPLSPSTPSMSSGLSPPGSGLTGSGGHTLFSNGHAPGSISPRTPRDHNSSGSAASSASSHSHISGGAVGGGGGSGISAMLNGSGSYPTSAQGKQYSLYGSGQHHFGPLLNVPTPIGGGAGASGNDRSGVGVGGGSGGSGADRLHHPLHSSAPPYGRHSPIPSAQTHFSPIGHVDMETVPPQSISPPLSPRRPMTPFTKEEVWMAREAGLIVPTLIGGAMDSDDFTHCGETNSGDDETIALLNAADTIKLLATKHVAGYNAICAENAELRKQLKASKDENSGLKKELSFLMGNELAGLNTEQLQSLKKTLKTAINKIKKQEFAQEMKQQGQKEQSSCVVCWASKVELTRIPCGHKSVCNDCELQQCPDCGQTVDGDKDPFSAGDVATEINKNINNLIS